MVLTGVLWMSESFCTSPRIPASGCCQALLPARPAPPSRGLVWASRSGGWHRLWWIGVTLWSWLEVRLPGPRCPQCTVSPERLGRCVATCPSASVAVAMLVLVVLVLPLWWKVARANQTLRPLYPFGTCALHTGLARAIRLWSHLRARRAVFQSLQRLQMDPLQTIRNFAPAAEVCAGRSWRMELEIVHQCHCAWFACILRALRD
mmetsp:Transcript_25226/g.64110  ORF Transcript_25226/g.64110 Transcript_25226/m.64110 type:complete len:205 (+) Transcript_25226:676-1290(+)